MSGNRNNKMKGWRDGQALLEVLTSMILLAFMSVSILGVCMQSWRWMSQARLHTQAGCLSYSLIEALRAGDVCDDWPEIAGKGWVEAGKLGMALLLPDNMKACIRVDKTAASDQLYIVGIRVEWNWRNERHFQEMYSRIREGQT